MSYSLNIDTTIQLVSPGETITAETGCLRGHGTHFSDGLLLATVSGTIERVNKLVSVKPIKQRYQGEVGDVVIGRITDVGQKKWKVDVNSNQDAQLLLSSIILPGVQRRRTNIDELNMHNFFAKNDLISAEVQQFHNDGSMGLHTRNLKYGKLENGQCITITPALVKRYKTHFHSLPCGADVILGRNGYVWIQETIEQKSDSMWETRITRPVSVEVREKLARVRNAILALNAQFIPIYPETIISTYEQSLKLNCAIKDMLKPNIIDKITQKPSVSYTSMEDDEM